MGENKTNIELDYIVWQYLQKETPSLATEFQKLKNLEAKSGTKITLDIIYDIYNKNKCTATKRQSENEIKSPVTKKPCLSEDENAEEDNTNEKENSEEQTNKEEETSTVNKKPINGEKSDQAQKTDDKVAKSADNKKPLQSEKNSSLKDSSKSKSAKSGANNRKKGKALLPKPKKKKPLLAAPFTSLHQNDPNFYCRDDTRKTLLPEPSHLPPSLVPSGRKTLLAEPLYSSSRNERRKTLLSDVPVPAYPEDERGRKTLLSEPLPLLAQNERKRKPLLMEPVPPPPLMQETARRIDRMGLLSESPPLTRLPPESDERLAFSHYVSMSDQLDALYRRERKSLLDEPPIMLHDYVKRRESLLTDPASDHYFDSRERKVGLLSDIPLPRGTEDMNRRKRTLLPDQPLPLSRRKCAKGLLDSADSSDRHLYRETSSLPKPLFSDKQEYDESSHLYSRRAQAKEPTSDNSQWKDKEALLNELKNYLRKHLSRSPERISNTAERGSLLEKPIDVHDYEEVDKHNRMPNLSRMSPDSYAYYMQEKKASMARNDYYQLLPESLSFNEKTMAHKSEADFAREEIISRNEALMRKYEEELKTIGITMNSELKSSFRRASEDDFRSLDQDRSYERYGGKMGFL